MVAYGTLKADSGNSVCETSFIYDYFVEQFIEVEELWTPMAWYWVKVVGKLAMTP
ncbi:hypothetical protein OK016_28685 [Vibrio chagasii]|nr:hypothetical protein [Vibrio chagasii]